MNIKKVLVLNEEEASIIINCGKLLRAIDTGVKSGDIDELAPDTLSLIEAVRRVSQEVLDNVDIGKENNYKENN